MSTLAVLLPIALLMGGVGLVAFLWCLRSGQYEDLDGAAERVLNFEKSDRPVADVPAQRKGHGDAQSERS